MRSIIKTGPKLALFYDMRNERIQFFLLSFLSLVIFALTMMTKKPLCIDSKVVNKIDRVSFEQTETVYQCGSMIKVPYSRYFDENKNQLESRIENTMQFLNQIEPFHFKITLQIDEKNPILFKVQHHQIIIGSQLLNLNGHLERAIFKVWLGERLRQDYTSQTLFSEVAADFLVYASFGSFEVEDPLLKIKTEIGKARWPQVLKSRETYCESAWRISEHYMNCDELLGQQSLTQENLMLLNLRPLMTSVWVEAYSSLSLAKKRDFLKKLPRYLQTQSLTSEKAIEMVMSEAHPLKMGMMNIKKMTDLMNSSSLVQDEPEYREFYARVAQNLQQAGVNDSFAEAYFDYIFEYPDEISTQSKFFKNIEQIAMQNPKLQIAVKDQNKIWILPNATSLPLTSFDQVHAQQHIFMACLKLKEINMTQFINSAERLLLIKGCDQNKTIDFSSLVTKGIQGFSTKNKHLAFIQFHLPSFQMKAQELSHIKDFFSLVQARDVTKPEFQTLGWSQVQWFEDSQAYKPQAVVDAIQLFRAESD